MIFLYFACYLLYLSMSVFHFAWYLPDFGISTSHLHGICYILVFQTYIWISRHFFWNQISDNMDRWKVEQGRGNKKRKIRRKKEDTDTRKKVGKSRNIVFFQSFVIIFKFLKCLFKYLLINIIFVNIKLLIT